MVNQINRIFRVNGCFVQYSLQVFMLFAVGSIHSAFSPRFESGGKLLGILAKALRGMRFSSKDALWSAVQQAWATVPEAQVQSLFHTMARRLTACIVANGGHTRYEFVFGHVCARRSDKW